MIFESLPTSDGAESCHPIPPLVTAFLDAAHKGDFEFVRHALNENSLLIWFYVSPELLGPIVDLAVKDAPGLLDASAVFQMFLARDKERLRLAPQMIQARVRVFPDNLPVFPMISAFIARIEGRATEAHALFRTAFPTQQAFEPFRDLRNVWPQFIAVQKGITAILAGRLLDALSHFHDATLRPSPYYLSFLTRDALVKGALIHATFGDPVEAELLLSRASRVRRTASWIEEGIDASAALALALIADDASVMLERLSETDAGQIGEVWPFYVHAHYRVLEKARANSSALKKIEFLKTLPFPMQTGDGYAGSVFHLAEASLSIAAGSPQRAREQLRMADPSFLLTRILSVLLELQVGSNHKVIKAASEIRDATMPFRRMELWRISLLAQAHLNLGEVEEARRTLDQTNSLTRRLNHSEVAYFSSELRSVPGLNGEHWYMDVAREECYLDNLPRHNVQLTEREYQVLTLLASGKPRKEMANTLFVSTNTLKSQLRAIYRKLGAHNRDEALRNAADRGLL